MRETTETYATILQAFCQTSTYVKNIFYSNNNIFNLTKHCIIRNFENDKFEKNKTISCKEISL